MTAGNQTPPGGRSDSPVGPGPAPDAEGRSGTPAADPADGGDRTGDDSADRADRAEPQAKPNPPVVPARVRMVSRDASTSAVPPNSMPPGRGDQGGHGRPSELFDPARPAGPAQRSEPAERVGTSQLFEPVTPPGAAPQAGDETGRTAVPGPTVPWDPSDPPALRSLRTHPGDDVSATGPASAVTPAPAPLSPGDAAPQSGTTPEPEDTTADDAAGAAASTSGDDPAGSLPAGSVPEPGIALSDSSSAGPADGEPVTGRSDASPATGGTVGAPTPPPPGTAAPGTSVEDPHRGTPPPGRPPAPYEPGPGSYAGPPTAPPHVPFPGGDPATRPPGYHQPPSVPARVPAPPGGQAIRPSTPPPAPPAPPATGRLRRLPVALLVVAVLIAGLAYVGYRQLTGGPPEGFRAVTSPGYELAVPQAWTPPTPGTPPLTVFGVPFGTAGQYGDYPCQTGSFPRAVAASALIAVPPNVGLDQAATAFARGSADALYPGTGAQVAVGTPAERALSTVTGSKVEATVRTDGAGGCRATDATVQVLVVPRTTAPDGSIGAAVLIVSGDLRGGPPQPAPLTRDELVGVLDTAALSTG